MSKLFGRRNIVIRINVLIWLFFISIFLISGFVDKNKSLMLVDASEEKLLNQYPESLDPSCCPIDEAILVQKSEMTIPFNPLTDDTLKIYYVGSYEPGHIAGQPQINGFFEALKNIEQEFDITVDIEGWYMDTYLTFNTTEQIRMVARHVIQDIENYHPDIILVTDDNAFEYIGIPLSNTYPIVFTGINASYQSYKQKYDDVMKDFNIFGVEELVNFDNLYHYFRISGIFPDKWYIIQDNTTVGEYATENFVEELEKFGVSYEIINTYSVQHFRSVIRRLNNMKPGVVVHNVHSLYDSPQSGHIGQVPLTRILINNNNKHLEYSVNKESSLYGVSIVNGPSFVQKGYLAGLMFLETLRNRELQHKVIRLHPQLTINYQRIGELDYFSSLNRHLEYVDNIVSSY